MPSLKAIYVRNPKCASNSIQKYLTDAGGADARKRQEYPLPILVNSRYFVFSFVRNPWERLLSAWLSKIREGSFLGLADHELTFVELVSCLENLRADGKFDSVNMHLRPQTTILSIAELDFVGRVESLEQDLHRLSDDLGIARVPLLRLHAFRADLVSQELYTPELVDRVARLYAEDITAYGYEFS